MTHHDRLGTLALAVLFTLGIIGVKETAAQEPASPACPPSVEQMDVPPEARTEEDLPGVISGARNPEKIPDTVAFRLLLRSLVPPAPDDIRAGDAPAQDASTAKVVRQAYERHVFTAVGLSDVETAALRAVAEEFGRRVKELDDSATEVKNLAWPDPGPEAIANLEQLQGQRDELVRELMSSLPQRLGAQAAARLNLYVREHVKAGMKMIQGPVSSPADRARATGDGR
jgi:hypothetical protein